MRVVRIFVKEGKVTFDFEGFQGRACLDVFSKLVEELKKDGIEIDVEKQELKPEAQVAVAQTQEEVVEQ